MVPKNFGESEWIRHRATRQPYLEARIPGNMPKAPKACALFAVEAHRPSPQSLGRPTMTECRTIRKQRWRAVARECLPLWGRMMHAQRQETECHTLLRHVH